jgi:tetratricopeptide (TPR) repeat protein
MPLALLLAAAWINVLTPAEVADQIAGRVSGEAGAGPDFLASDLRDVPARQRSMRVVFDHSWSLLTARERGMVQAMSVFCGGFTRQAAREVAGVSLRDLRSLVDRSLLHRAAPGRYEMHALLRQYATEKLDRSPGAGEAARDGHCAYYAAALARWAADLKGPRQQEALAEVEAEIDNVRAAWTWAVERGRVEWLGQAMEGLGRLYKEQVLYEEGETAFRFAADRLVERADDLGPTKHGAAEIVRAYALAWQASFCRHLGRIQGARDLLRQSMELLNGLAPADTRRERAFALHVLGGIENTSGNLENAYQPLTQSLALYRALDRHWEMAVALSCLASTAQGRGEFDKAKELRQEGIALRRRLGDQKGLASQLFALSMTFRSLGQFEEYERWGREGQAIARDVGDRDLICRGLKHMAGIRSWKGEFAQSRLLMEQSVRIGHDIGAGPYWMYYASQRALGFDLAHLGHYREARAHLQRALALAQEANSSWVIGVAFLGLGLVELAEGNPAAARRYLLKGIAVVREMGRRYKASWFHAALAGAARGLGQLSEARTHLCEALQQSGEMRDQLTPLHVLPVAARFLADLGDAERAVEIYALASRYGFVANSRLWEDIAGREIAALAAALPPEIVAATRRRGRARDLWVTMEELLSEWAE